MNTFEERVADAYEWAERHSVLRVDSDAAMREVRRLTERRIETFRSGVIFDMDYRKQEPALPMLEAYPQIAEHDDYCYFITDAKAEAAVRNGERLHSIFKPLEELGVESHLFISSAHKMSVSQCSSLVSLTVSMQNSGTLQGVRLYLPGGDWWDTPEFVADHRAGGADLGYARISGLDARLGQAFQREWQAGFSRLGGCSSTNVYGPHFSGKTGFLHGMTMYGTRPLWVSVYDDGTTADAVLERAQKRDIGDKVLLLDDVHRLVPGALDTIRAKHPNIMCASLERLPGFDYYVDTNEFLEK